MSASCWSSADGVSASGAAVVTKMTEIPNATAGTKRRTIFGSIIALLVDPTMMRGRRRNATGQEVLVTPSLCDKDLGQFSSVGESMRRILGGIVIAAAVAAGTSAGAETPLERGTYLAHSIVAC